MRIVDNCAGGETVVLSQRDQLAAVPPSHQTLLTDALTQAFDDPVAYFKSIADSCPFPAMTAWLRSLLATPTWKLELGKCNPDYGDWTLAGFLWSSKQVRGATIALPSAPPSGLPDDLLQYYALVDAVHWSEFGGAGGLNGRKSHESLMDHPFYCEGKPDPENIRIWGSSGGGDMLIYTLDGRGGWLCHENGCIHWLGSIADTIEWVYGELLANREPDFNYQWLKNR